MSKIGNTKKDILKILSKKQQTITDVSKILNLSPSTVKQHFDELVEMGAIVQVENEFIKRWKYYKKVPSFNIKDFKKENSITSVIPYAVGSIIIIGMLSLFLFYFSTNAHNTSPNVNPYSLTIQLTDPPQVPINTKSLILNYSSISVKTLSPNNTQTWINITNPGSVDLMSLINTSEILGDIKIKSGYKLEGVILNAKNANIIIGNQTYPVILLNNKVYATVPQNSIINSNSSVLIDFSPTVSNVYTNNSILFIMTPSVKAIFSNNFKLFNNSKNGTKFNLTYYQYKSFLNKNTNLSIISSNITQNKNNTSIKITIKNLGNKTINIKQIILSGQIDSQILLQNKSEIFINNNHFNNNINISIHKININNSKQIGKISISVIKNKSNNSTLIQNNQIETMKNSFFRIKQYYFDNQNILNNFQIKNMLFGEKLFEMPQNFSNNNYEEITISNLNLSNPEEINTKLGINLVYIHQLVFFVNKNASLKIPQFSLFDMQNTNSFNNFMQNNTGYQLLPGNTVTLTFNGNITCGNNFIKGELLDNSTYKLVVIASNDTLSQTNVVSNS
ncbi:MAG: ArsR family transcriptional regulator [Candidatus Micrarchaeaceae archaeon]